MTAKKKKKLLAKKNMQTKAQLISEMEDTIIYVFNKLHIELRTMFINTKFMDPSQLTSIETVFTSVKNPKKSSFTKEETKHFASTIKEYLAHMNVSRCVVKRLTPKDTNDWSTRLLFLVNMKSWKTKITKKIGIRLEPFMKRKGHDLEIEYYEDSIFTRQGTIRKKIKRTVVVRLPLVHGLTRDELSEYALITKAHWQGAQVWANLRPV